LILVDVEMRMVLMMMMLMMDIKTDKDGIKLYSCNMLKG